jgi:hypothetical protein
MQRKMDDLAANKLLLESQANADTVTGNHDFSKMEAQLLKADSELKKQITVNKNLAGKVIKMEHEMQMEIRKRQELERRLAHLGGPQPNLSNMNRA